MSRQYPIWNRVQACIYKSSKNWGAKDDSVIEVLCGSSSGKSELLGKVHTKREVYLSAGVTAFFLRVNSVNTKSAVWSCDKSGNAVKLIYKYCYVTNRITHVTDSKALVTWYYETCLAHFEDLNQVNKQLIGVHLADDLYESQKDESYATIIENA